MTRLSTVASRAPRRTLVAATVLGVLAGVIGSGTPSHLSSSSTEFYSHGSQSYQTARLLEAAAGPKAFPDLEVVFPVSAQHGPDVFGLVQSVASTAPHIFYSRNHRSVALLGDLRHAVSAGPTADGLVRRFRTFPGITVGGSALIRQQSAEQVKRDLAKAELIAFPLLLMLAFIVFRSAIAALLPIITSGLVLSVTLLGLRAVNAIHPISILSLDVVEGLSLGLSLDYSLLLVARYREELSRGLQPPLAVFRTMTSAGRTVAISSLTVATAFASPLVFPVGVLRSLAVGGMLAALSAGAVALLVLPAAFSLLGHNVNALAPKRWHRSVGGELPSATNGAWYRLARYVMAHPKRIAFTAATALLLVSTPALGTRLTGLDAVSLLPASASARRFNERIRREFEQPLLGEVVVAAHGDHSSVDNIVTRYLSKLPDVAFGETYHLGGNLWALAIRESEGPFSEASLRLVRSIRASRHGLTVTGSTAVYIDTASSLRSRLPLALGLLMATTLLLLFAATRSIVLPIKTILMNILSFTASLGLLVLIFQDGRLQGVLEYRTLGALVVIQPVLLGAGIFGISTDYGIFMLTRIKEGWDSGLSNSDAVAVGLERTGRIISAVALLFCVAVGALATARTTFVKEAALGMTLAVAIDATIVRSLLVPSLMTLLGRWNWWCPRAFCAPKQPTVAR